MRMSYTQQQFNEMARRLKYGNIKYKEWPSLDYYNDLNQLMPLFWKLGGGFEQFEDDDGRNWQAIIWMDSKSLAGSCHEDPIQAIRDCLWTIWQEGNTN